MFNRKPKDAIIPYPNNNIDIKNISNKIMPDPDTDLTKNILDETEKYPTNYKRSLYHNSSNHRQRQILGSIHYYYLFTLEDLVEYPYENLKIRNEEQELDSYMLLTSKNPCLLGGIYQPIQSSCMKKIISVTMAFLTGGVTISALGLGVHGAEAMRSLN